MLSRCHVFPLYQDELGLREDTYELCYNAACLSLGENDIEAAEAKLKKAEGNEIPFGEFYPHFISLMPCMNVSHLPLLHTSPFPFLRYI